MDHVSDLFLETTMPLLVLIEAAKAGNEQQVEEFSQLFHDHANKLIEVQLIQLCFTTICCHTYHMSCFPVLRATAYML